MKRFKNNFGVKGSLPLLMALKEEVEKLGWKYDYDFAPWGKRPDLYFNANNEEVSMKTQHFSSSSVYTCTIYILPQQWDECLKAASELEERIPEYVRLLHDDYGFKKDDIAKVIGKKASGYIVFVPKRHSYSTQYPNVWYNISCTEPSTKEAYEKQQKEFKIKELLKEAERRYPVGTIVNSLGGNSKAAITEPTFTLRGNNPKLIQNHGDCLVYDNGKWAEIIKPKVVEPWTTGTYVVFLKKYGGSKKGDIDIIRRFEGIRCFLVKEGIGPTPSKPDISTWVKWFPTLQEAEAFSRELLKEVEPMEIAGYNVKFKEDKVSIGCYEDITLKDLKTMKKAIKIVSKFGKDLTVTEDSIIDSTEDAAIFLDEIEQLIERLDG
jgi:hypothetical protein